jgi:hypothetical protein
LTPEQQLEYDLKQDEANEKKFKRGYTEQRGIDPKKD